MQHGGQNKGPSPTKLSRCSAQTCECHLMQQKGLADGSSQAPRDDLRFMRWAPPYYIRSLKAEIFPCCDPVTMEEGQRGTTVLALEMKQGPQRRNVGGL